MAKIDDSVKKKVPELRFPGFTDDWEERKLKDIAQFNPKTVLPDEFEYVDLESVVGTEMISHRTESKDQAPSRAQRLAQKGDVFYQTVRPYQMNNYLYDLPYDNYVFSTGYAQMRPNIDSYFLLNSVQNKQFVQHVLDRSTGTSYPAINSSDLSNIEIHVPSKLSEQQKIGAFFQSIDDTIALHQRKLDLLKEQKKGFLQKMFPKNGAKVPELRFAGFADDWEERKLGEVIDIENGYAFKSEYFSDEEKRHIVLTPGSVKIGGGFQKDKGRYYDVSGVFPEKFIFKPGNIFITMTDLTPTAQSLGYPAIVPRDDNVYLHNQRLGKIINNTTNPEFLYTLLTTDTYHKEIVSSASGTTVKHSSVSKILDFKSAIPNIDEQKLIGSFFKELDNTIALHQRKLDLLKEQKKGFLQKMFV
ncbi:restriction endonuclease subunit S (plasmid) [Enterococcus faecalis]|uniref:Type I restriction-modification system, specificity subunit S n=1 Tax=Streptococcus gallolyticus TaxID=315405 RepID=A0A8F9SFF5_9STRE|nr:MULTISPECIES: restriction endonuclease subunit S [Lactobacillales]NVT10472.1 restriction endonuclease subunit S [Listeria monocytogenes]MCE7021162.1 restriction endonuclease subunit S [Enterococcus faecalis]NVT10491.1 restriction endonuclease subunit S [Listeria monocytogenes]NVT33966.1 restriction endonuclease subunit S [Listeria monocytogenes]QYL33239.1 Type I restriction-modification system, specificity subunit S [Streptococcus gallolyticus]